MVHSEIMEHFFLNILNILIIQKKTINKGIQTDTPFYNLSNIDTDLPNNFEESSDLRYILVVFIEL